MERPIESNVSDKNRISDKKVSLEYRFFESLRLCLRHSAILKRDIGIYHGCDDESDIVSHERKKKIWICFRVVAVRDLLLTKTTRSHQLVRKVVFNRLQHRIVATVVPPVHLQI